jgi:hypothetical protein
MTPEQAEFFQNDRYRGFTTHYGIQIFYNSDDDTYLAQILDYPDFVSHNLEDLKDRINIVLIDCFYESLMTIADSLGEKEKDFLNPVKNYENVVDAFVNKVKDSF